jgi:hypothetical protein
VLAAYYYGYVATQLMGGRLSETIGAKMVYGTGIMLSGVFTLLAPAAVRAKFYAFIAIRVLTGAASVWPNVQEVGMCRNKKSKWKNIGQHEPGVYIRPTLSKCCIPPTDLHLLFLQTKTRIEFTFARKMGTCLPILNLLPIRT